MVLHGWLGLAWIASTALGMQTILCMRVAISNPVVTKSFVACQLEDNCIVAGEEPPEMWLSVAVCHHFGRVVLFVAPALYGTLALVLQPLDTTFALSTSAYMLLSAKECFDVKDASNGVVCAPSCSSRCVHSLKDSLVADPSFLV